jgi:hypothetical protein
MKTAFLFVSVLFFTCVMGQAPHVGMFIQGNFDTKVITNEGVTDLIKGVKRIGITYDYSMMSVDGYGTEQDFVNSVTKKYKPAKAEAFKQKWYDHRKEALEPYFLELFNKYAGSAGIEGVNYITDADATLNVQINRLTPGEGYNATYFIDAYCALIDKSGEFVVGYTINNAVGEKAGKEYKRMTPCFKIMGKQVAKRLAKLKTERVKTLESKE